MAVYRFGFSAALLLWALAAPFQPAAAADQSGCRIGAAVTDRQNRSGTITGVRNGMCVVQFANGETSSYLAWMLNPTGAPSSAAPAAAQQSADQYGCTIGAQVTDRQNRSGTITGVRNGMCLVRLADGETTTYLAWMLNPAGTKQTGGTATVALGRYECWASAAGGASSYYTLVDINLTSASQYSDKKGTSGAYAYDPGTRRIAFQSGPFVGQRAEYLEADKIGISSKPSGFFDMVCNRKA